jgi:hypothetical protein
MPDGPDNPTLVGKNRRVDAYASHSRDARRNRSRCAILGAKTAREVAVHANAEIRTKPDREN